MRGRTRTVNRPSQSNQGDPVSCNGRSEVFPYEKAYEGVTHCFVGSGATPTGCARAHPRAKKPQTIPSRSLRGSRNTVEYQF
jgi:hypothetical protein